MWGLADHQVAQAHRAGYTAPVLARLSLQAAAVVIYPQWFPARPATWRPVASWSVYTSTILGGSEVVFYATPRTSQIVLARQLQAFHDQLPEAVTVKEVLGIAEFAVTDIRPPPSEEPARR